MMMMMIMTAPVSESAAPAFDVEIPHTAGVASSREPTLPSVPIVSMHDSNTTTTRAGGGALREPVMGRTTTKRVSRSAYATHAPSLPFFPSSFRSRVWSHAAKASALGGLSLTLLSSFQKPDTRLCAAIVAVPKF
jgi:hypothetical protein